MKRIFAVVFALMLVMSGMALAAESVETQNVDTAVVEPEAVVAEMSVTLGMNEAVETAIAAFENVAAISVYSAETQEAIAAIAADPENLEVIEATGIMLSGYESGDVVAEFEFATDFSAFNEVIAVITVDGTDFVCPAEVTEAGTLIVTIAESCASAIAGSDSAYIVILAD